MNVMLLLLLLFIILISVAPVLFGIILLARKRTEAGTAIIGIYALLIA